MGNAVEEVRLVPGVPRKVLASDGHNQTVFYVNDPVAGSTTFPSPVQMQAATDMQAITYTLTAGATLAAGKAVTANGIVADSTDGTKPAIGVSALGAASGAPCVVTVFGPIKGVLTSATAGRPVFLDVTGGLTQTLPVTSGHAFQTVGYAINATDLFVATAYFGTHA